MRKYLNPATGVIIGVIVVLLALATWTVFGTSEDGDSIQSEFFEEDSPAERTGPTGGGPIASPEAVIEPDKGDAPLGESQQLEAGDDKEVKPPVTSEAVERGATILEPADEPAYESADQPQER